MHKHSVTIHIIETMNAMLQDPKLRTSFGNCNIALIVAIMCVLLHKAYALF